MVLTKRKRSFISFLFDWSIMVLVGYIMYKAIQLIGYKMNILDHSNITSKVFIPYFVICFAKLNNRTFGMYIMQIKFQNLKKSEVGLFRGFIYILFLYGIPYIIYMFLVNFIFIKNYKNALFYMLSLIVLEMFYLLNPNKLYLHEQISGISIKNDNQI